MAFSALHWSPKALNRMQRRRNKLAKAPTPIEKKMIRYLTEMALPYEFQVVIDRYIVDFYLPAFKTIIEVDGAYHDEPDQRDKDELRDYDLKRRGYRVLRIPGWQVFTEPLAKGLVRDFLGTHRAIAS